MGYHAVMKLAIVGVDPCTSTQKILSEVDGDQLKGLVDQDVADFDTFFQTLDNSPLLPPELSILKTYIWWKTHGEPVSAQSRGEASKRETDADKTSQ